MAILAALNAHTTNIIDPNRRRTEACAVLRQALHVVLPKMEAWQTQWQQLQGERINYHKR